MDTVDQPEQGAQPAQPPTWSPPPPTQPQVPTAPQPWTPPEAQQGFGPPPQPYGTPGAPPPPAPPQPYAQPPNAYAPPQRQPYPRQPYPQAAVPPAAGAPTQGPEFLAVDRHNSVVIDSSGVAFEDHGISVDFSWPEIRGVHYKASPNGKALMIAVIHLDGSFFECVVEAKPRTRLHEWFAHLAQVLTYYRPMG